MRKIKFITTRKTIIKAFAQQLAEYQRQADIWYYERNDKEMSSYMCGNALTIKEMADRLGICSEVYNRAYEIYDFRNSGRKGYTLKNGKIVKCDSEVNENERNSF